MLEVNVQYASFYGTATVDVLQKEAEISDHFLK